ncbi:hypothetical protein OAH12_01955 [Cyclobacteriaceae bacterium]|nr:hypothetical protein [Cyclobacteriaceae bacterium]
MKVIISLLLIFSVLFAPKNQAVAIIPSPVAVVHEFEIEDDLEEENFGFLFYHLCYFSILLNQCWTSHW